MPSSHVALEAETVRCLKAASDACARRGSKLTELRQQVLTILCQSEKPLGAYQIMEALAKISDRQRVAPPTVYRTLEFLLSIGAVHRIHSINAYMSRSSLGRNACEALFLCEHCGRALEVPNATFQQTINLAANELKFQVQQQAVEISGTCHQCRATNRDDTQIGERS